MRVWDGKAWVETDERHAKAFEPYTPTAVPGSVPRLDRADEKKVRAYAARLAGQVVEKASADGAFEPGSSSALIVASAIGYMFARLVAENERLRRALAAARATASVAVAAADDDPKGVPNVD